MDRNPLLAEITGGETPVHPGVVYDIRGAGGIGKSTLLDDVETRLRERGTFVLRVALGRVTSTPDAEKADLVSAYRTIVETLSEGLPEEAVLSLKNHVREVVRGQPATGPALDAAKDDITDAFVGALTGCAERSRVAILVDDLSNLPRPLANWVTVLLSRSSRARETIVVVTRSAQDAELEIDGEVRHVALGPLSRDEVAHMMAERTTDADAQAWTAAIERWCGNYPGAAALAVSIAAEQPDAVAALEDPSMIAGRGDQLLDDIFGSIADATEREALEIAAVARSFNGTLLKTVMTERDTLAPDIGERLAKLPFIEPAESDGTYRARPFLRTLVATRLTKLSTQGDDARAENRLEELHWAIAQVYRDRVDEFQQDQPYRSWIRFERQETQRDLLEFLHHACHLTDEWAQLSITSVYLDAFWWWGAYLELEFCHRLLTAWGQLARPRDQKLLDALKQFQASYPPSGRHEEGTWDGRAVAPASAWDEVLDALATIGKITDRDDAVLAEEKRARGIVAVFLGEAYRFRDKNGDAAAKRFQTAEEAFSGSEKNAWCLPWVRWQQADLELEPARRNLGEADRLAVSGLEMSQMASPEDYDHEVEANLHRVRGDSRWQEGERERAFWHYSNAVFSAYAFNVPPDEYTRTFYREITGRTLDRVLELAREDREKARQVCEALSALWTPYWQKVGHAPEPSSIDTLLDEGRAVGVCLFPSEADDCELAVDGEYARTVTDVSQKLQPQFDQMAREAFDREGVTSRLRGLFRRRGEPRGESLRVSALELPDGHAEPADLFEPPDDPVWPDHWRTLPRDWRTLAAEPARQADIRAVVDRAIDALPEGWRTVVKRRDVEGWTHEDVARRLGVSRSSQTVILHHARVRIRRALADYFERASNGGT